MPGMGSGSLKFLGREPVIFSIFLLPRTWLVQGSGCFGQTRRQWKPAGVTRKVNNLSCHCLLLWSKGLCRGGDSRRYRSWGQKANLLPLK